MLRIKPADNLAFVLLIGSDSNPETFQPLCKVLTLATCTKSSEAVFRQRIKLDLLIERQSADNLFFVSRTLAEFWHWFVANIPGDSLDEGEVVFDLLFPLVLPDGNGDHRSAFSPNFTK